MGREVTGLTIVALGMLCSVDAHAQTPPAQPSDEQRQRIARDISELKSMKQDMSRQMGEFDARIQALETELHGAPQGAAATGPAVAGRAPSSAPGVAPAYATPPSTKSDTWEVYGFAQVDAIYDTKRVDPDWDDAFRPSKIPTEEGVFGSNGQTSISVKQSRLGAKASGEAGGENYEAKFEFDIFGTGVDAGQTTFRLRHAYGRWGPVLGGQTNSLFMDGDLFPNVIDYWGPTGMVFLRNPQVRFYIADSPTFSAAVAIEKPGNDIDPGRVRQIDPDLGANLRNTEDLPDATAQVRFMGDWGHVQVAGILRKVGFETIGATNNEPKGSELGWGINLGGSYKLDPVTFRVGVVYGQGIASYMNDGGTDLAPRVEFTPTPDAKAKALPLLGVTAYVDVNWSDQWTSSFGYSRTEVDNTNFQDATAYHSGDYASGNVLWSPIPRVLTGAELMWGQRTDNDGDKGDDVRIQFSFKVSFSSNDVLGK